MIDADELLEYKNDHEMISTHLIYNAPTVEAIPIEWISKVAVNHIVEAQLMNVIKGRPTANPIPIEWIKNWLPKKFKNEHIEKYERAMLVSALGYLEVMIEDWEKENENNDR